MVMDTSRNVTNEQELYDNAASDGATHDCPDILSTYIESSCTVTLQPESTEILQAMNDDQLCRTAFETLPDPVENTACSNNLEVDNVNYTCSSTSAKQTMDAHTFSSTLVQSVQNCTGKCLRRNMASCIMPLELVTFKVLMLRKKMKSRKPLFNCYGCEGIMDK